MTDRCSISQEEAAGKALLAGHADVLRAGLESFVKWLMETEATALAGAPLGVRSADRKDSRNGYRPRMWDTRVGTLDLLVPKLRKTGYVPSFLEPRQRAEKALLAVIQEAYVHGVSTRKVENLLQGLGVVSVSKSEVSRVCEELDQQVNEFRRRRLSAEAYPYVWLDARYEKVREGVHVVSNAVVVAYAVKDTGEREVIGIDVGPSEDEAFWSQFLRSLVERGLRGVRLVISDAHKGLKKAIREVLCGSVWQRCRVHFMRNVLASVSKKAQPVVSAMLKSIFSEPDHGAARDRVRRVLEALRKERLDRAATVIEDGIDDALAYMHFPSAHWRQIHSTNPLERLNRELARRSAVVGIFPNAASVLRLFGMILIEQNDEWSIGRRYFSQESMTALAPAAAERVSPALTAEETARAA